MGKFIDLTGQKFGRLTVAGQTEKNKHKQTCWICKCDCGTEIRASTADLRRLHTQSCGCLQSEKVTLRNFKHGHSVSGGSKTFTSWRGMVDRCTNKQHKFFMDYGGRGITVCDEWLLDFRNFLEDMGERPEGQTLERKNNEKGYSKDNCRWATRKEQGNNKRNNVLLAWGGKTLTLQQLAENIGISPSTLFARLYRHKWSLSDAVTTPVATRKHTEMRG
jgi:hypothetical protein